MRIFGLYIGRYQGKDRLTRTPLMNYYDPAYLINGISPQWVTVDNLEGELYRTTAVLQRVINKKATLFSNGVFKHYKMGSNGKSEIIDNSPLIASLEKPNPIQSRSEWLMEEMIHRCVWGNSFINPIYAIKRSDIDPYPAMFWNLQPQFMQINRTGKMRKQNKIEGIIKEYVLRYPDGVTDTFDPKEVIHGRIINPEDSLVGLSPLYGLQMPISNWRAAMGLRNVVLTEKGALGFISLEQGKDAVGPIAMTEAERTEIDKQFSKTHGQFDEQAKVKFINRTAKWNPTTFPMREMMVFDETNEDLMQIIDAYDMNIHVFSQAEGSTYANAQEGKKMAYQDGIIPYANDFCFNLNKKLGLNERNEWVDLDYSHIECLQEDQATKATTMKTKAEAYKILFETGNFQDEEVRALLNLEIPED